MSNEHECANLLVGVRCLLTKVDFFLLRYLGNSWASGIALFGGRPYLNGRNQESSSEAIAAYEAIAMFGSVMMKAYGNGQSLNPSDNENAYTACQIFNIGRFLATTEIRSADRYWHVYSPKRDQIYRKGYILACSHCWSDLTFSLCPSGR